MTDGLRDRSCGDVACLSGHTFMLGRVVYRCIHEACRPEESTPRELKHMQPVILPHYTATLTVQRDDAEGEVIVRGVVTGPAAAVVTTLSALADAFEAEAQR